jgi:hypothetical protein
MLTRLPFFTTPIGIIENSKIHQPNTKFEPEGTYSLKLRLSGNEAKEFAKFLNIKIIESIEDAELSNIGATVKQANFPYAWDKKDLLINFRMKASGFYKDGVAWARKPTVFNSNLSPLEITTEIGIGSKVVVSYTTEPFFKLLIGAGVSMRLEAIQIIQFVNVTPSNEYGFFIRN